MNTGRYNHRKNAGKAISNEDNGYNEIKIEARNDVDELEMGNGGDKEIVGRQGVNNRHLEGKGKKARIDTAKIQPWWIITILASICFGISIADSSTILRQRQSSGGKDLNETKEMHGYIRPDKIFGHVHIAKTGGSTVNSRFANKFERVCGNKGSSFEAYARNEFGLKKLQGKDSLPVYGTNHKSSYPGFEDCDYISMEKPWQFWNQTFPGGKFHNVPVELHVPCRDPLEHLMSQCNHNKNSLTCDSSTEEGFYKSIDKCLQWNNRFDFRLKEDFSVKCYDFGKEFKEYDEVMAHYLEPRRFVPDIIVPRHSNTRPRNKTAECIWDSPDLQKMATDYLFKKQSYYHFCSECIGGEDDITMMLGQSE